MSQRRRRAAGSSSSGVLALAAVSFGSATAAFVSAQTLSAPRRACALLEGRKALAEALRPLPSAAPNANPSSWASALAAGAGLAAAGLAAAGRGNRRSLALRAWPWEDDDPYSKCTALKLQVGLQFSKAFLDTLNKLADSADTSTDQGLHQLLLDVVLALRRSESSWRYACCERLLSDSQDEGRAAGAAMQRWGLEGQSKWGDGDQWEKMTKNPGMTEYVVLTFTVSCYGSLCKEKEELKIRGLTDLKTVLDAVSGVQVDELMSVDVQWIPEEEGDSLSAMEVTMKFPEMVML